MAIDILTLALAKKMSGSSGGSAIQSDWNQNDETASDYIKNRPFYESSGLEVISECEISSISSYSDASCRLYAGNVDLPSAEYVYGKEYTIEVNGETYVMSLTQQLDDMMGDYFVGFNIADGARVAGTPKFNNNVLFGAYGRVHPELSDGDTFTASLSVYLAQTVSLPATIRVGLEAETLVQLDPKYIKDMYYSEVKEQTVEIDLTKGNESSSGLKLVVDIETAQFIYDNWEKSEFIMSNTGLRFKIFSGTVTETEKRCILSTSDRLWEFELSINLTNCTVKSAIGMGGGMHGIISIPVEHEEIHTIDTKYIKDMYYDNGITTTEIVSDMTLTSRDGNDYVYEEDFLRTMFTEGNTYIVNWNGVKYTCLARNSGYGEIYIGNQTLSDDWSFSEVIESDEPFFIATFKPNSWSVVIAEAGTYTISITEIKHDLKQLDIKYLPMMEETIETVLKMDNAANGEFEDPAYKILVGKHIVTIDGVSETVKFVFMESDSFSFADHSLGLMNTYINPDTGNGVIFFDDLSDGTHSVKIEAVKNIVKEEHLPDSVKTQPDWNQNDETAADYVKNRPFYDATKEVVLIDEMITITDSYYESSQFIYEFGRNLGLEVGNSYNITFLGETFENVTYNGNIQFTLSSGATINIVDDHINSLPGDGLSRPFDADIKIWSTTEEIVKIDPKYLPNNEMPIFATYQDENGQLKLGELDPNEPRYGMPMTVERFEELRGSSLEFKAWIDESWCGTFHHDNANGFVGTAITCSFYGGVGEGCGAIMNMAHIRGDDLTVRTGFAEIAGTEN